MEHLSQKNELSNASTLDVPLKGGPVPRQQREQKCPALFPAYSSINNSTVIESASKGEFDVGTREAGAGVFTLSVEGPAKVDFKDRKDGTCYATFKIPEPARTVNNPNLKIEEVSLRVREILHHMDSFVALEEESGLEQINYVFQLYTTAVTMENSNCKTDALLLCDKELRKHLSVHSFAKILKTCCNFPILHFFKILGHYFMENKHDILYSDEYQKLVREDPACEIVLMHIV